MSLTLGTGFLLTVGMSVSAQFKLSDASFLVVLSSDHAQADYCDCSQRFDLVLYPPTPKLPIFVYTKAC